MTKLMKLMSYIIQANDQLDLLAHDIYSVELIS
jgi:hypothetical protein